MTSNLNRSAIACLVALVCCATANAQSDVAPLTRSEVKSQTRAAVQGGELTPAGQGPTVSVPKASNKTRAQRKAETDEARKAGALAAAGEGGLERTDREIRARPSTVNRAARKDATRAAEKAGELIPAGEGVVKR